MFDGSESSARAPFTHSASNPMINSGPVGSVGLRRRVSSHELIVQADTRPGSLISSLLKSVVEMISEFAACPCGGSIVSLSIYS